MDLASIEALFAISFPATHREALSDPTDPVHEACDFLVPESPHELLRLVEANQFLRSSQRPDPWPAFLLAFASNGCGDYFAYDLRAQPPTIVYIDPDHTVQQNLSSSEPMVFKSFDAWYVSKVPGALEA